MLDTKEQLQEYIAKIFNSVELFEWDVLHVSTNADRAEVVALLAESFVQDSLKNFVNFLYIRDIEHIQYTKIKQEMFKEIVAEWVSFCDEVLHVSKEEAIQEVRKEGRTTFINAIVGEYFQKFQRVIYGEMFNSLLEYFNKLPITKDRQIFIDKVLQSSLNRDSRSISIHKFSQLQTRVMVAKESKDKEVFKLKNRIKDLKKQLHSSHDINFEQDNEILYDIEDLEEDLEELESMPLYHFDELIASLRENMIESMRVANS